MSTALETKVDILIQGAGIGGLTLAIAMLRKGYTVRVVERAGNLAEVGAGIWMAANAMQVFDRLGFADAIAAAGWAVHRVTLQDYNGDVLQASDLSAVSKLFGFETVALHRAVLQRVLFAELPPDLVTFGTEVERLTQDSDGVSVVLANGAAIRARMVAGADGLRSRIRTLAGLQGEIRGGEMRYSGSSSYRAIAKGADLLPVELDHDAYEIWGKGCRLGFSKIGAEQCYWYMTFDSAPDKSSSAIERRGHAESLFHDFFPQWIHLLEKTDPDDILQTDISDLKRLPTWWSGRVGLIGDAAHATTPNLGQGGAMAIEDAYALANAVETAGLNGKAFELYETMRREKVDWTVSTSWNIGRMCHWKNPVLRSLRNAALKMMLSKGGEKQIRKLYSLG